MRYDGQSYGHRPPRAFSPAKAKYLERMRRNTIRARGSLPEGKWWT